MPMQGHCNCSAIKVTIADEIPAENNNTVFCHCSNCRRQSGALGTYVMILDDKYVTVEGQPKDYVDNQADSGKPLHRWFCGDCGSPIMSTSEAFAGKTIVKMGLFDKIPAPVAECYTRNRQEWGQPLPNTAQINGAPGAA